MPIESTFYTEYRSRLGLILLTSQRDHLTGLWFLGEKHSTQVVPSGIRDDAPFATAILQLEKYFLGELQEFDVPIELRGTPFQKEVWAALREIPYGQTWSYAKLAAHLGRPKAMRAVGAANGQNPISIIVPCHRVIGSSGSMVGYGGGLENKLQLLRLERVIL